MLWLVQTDVHEVLNPSAIRTRSLTSETEMTQVLEECMSQVQSLLGKTLLYRQGEYPTTIRIHQTIRPKRPTLPSSPPCCG